MAAPINQFVSLKDVILMYSEAAKQSDSTYLRLWRMAFRGFQQMGLNSFWSAKTLVIPVNPNLTATLPPDFIQWIKVGCFNDAGEIQILSVNDNLTTFKDTSSNRLSQIASQVNLVTTNLTVGGYYWNFFNPSDSNGDYNYPAFGLGSQLLTPGSCTVDVTNNVIVLDTAFAYPSIVLYYISSPEQDVDYQIPIQFQEAMIAWLYWQDNQYMPNISKGSAAGKQQAAANFASQLKLARKMYKPIRIEEIALASVEKQQYNVH